MLMTAIMWCVYKQDRADQRALRDGGNSLTISSILGHCDKRRRNIYVDSRPPIYSYYIYELFFIKLIDTFI